MFIGGALNLVVGVPSASSGTAQPWRRSRPTTGHRYPRFAGADDASTVIAGQKTPNRSTMHLLIWSPSRRGGPGGSSGPSPRRPGPPCASAPTWASHGSGCTAVAVALPGRNPSRSATGQLSPPSRL